MTDIISFFRNALQYTYNAVAAVASFNHKVVSSLLHGSVECYRATTTIVKGLSSAIGDILYYIGDFILEALNVVVVCLRFMGKFMLLIYHIMASLAGGLLLTLECFGSLVAHSIDCLCSGLHSFSTYLSQLWTTCGPGISESLVEATDAISEFCSNIFRGVSSAVISLTALCVKTLNYVGENINARAQCVADVIYSNAKNAINGGINVSQYAADGILGAAQYAAGAVHASCKSAWDKIWSIGSNCVKGLFSFLGECITPFCFSLKQLKGHSYALWKWLGLSLSSIPTSVYIYILVTTLIIILFKIVMGHMTRHGFSLPNLTRRHRSRPAPWRVRNLMIDSSDEEWMDDEDDMQENMQQVETDTEDELYIEDNGELDDIQLSDTDTSINDQSDSDDSSSQTNGHDDLDDVEEFELASDSDSEGGSEAPIQIELPERYNLRTRASPSLLPSDSSPGQLTPGQLEKHLETERDKRLCVVCVDQDKNVLVLPCRHMCLCVDCAHEMVNQRMRTRRVCPLCRTPIETVMNVFT